MAQFAVFTGEQTNLPIFEADTALDALQKAGKPAEGEDYCAIELVDGVVHHYRGALAFYDKETNKAPEQALQEDVVEAPADHSVDNSYPPPVEEPIESEVTVGDQLETPGFPDTFAELPPIS